VPTPGRAILPPNEATLHTGKNLKIETLKRLSDAKVALLLFAIGLLLFMVGHEGREFIRINARYGCFINEMLQNGVGLYPTLFGEPYPDYLSPHVALMCLAAKLFGGVSLFAAVFPTALASSVTLALVYLIGATRSRQLGLAAALLCLMTTEFVMQSRSPAPDPFLTAITTLCFYLQLRHAKTRDWLTLLPLPLLLVAGYGFRGPIGVVVPSAVIVVFQLLAGNYRLLAGLGTLCALTLAACFGAQMELTTLEYGAKYMAKVFNAQVTCRLSGPSPEDIAPFYFYFISGLYFYALAFPLALLVLASNVRSMSHDWRDDDVAFIRQLGGWLLIILVGLSVPSLKHVRYIMPAMPAAALLAGLVFVGNIERKPVLALLRKILPPLLLFGPTAALALAFAGTLTLSKIYSRPTNWPLLVTLVVLAALSLPLLRRGLRNRGAWPLLPLAYGAVGYMIVHVLVIEAAEQAAERSMPFVSQAESQREPGESLVFWQIGPDGDDLKYTLGAGLLKAPIYVSGDEQEILKEIGTGALVIAKNRNFNALSESFQNKCEVVANGNLGHRSCVAFRLTKPPTKE